MRLNRWMLVLLGPVLLFSCAGVKTRSTASSSGPAPLLSDDQLVPWVEFGSDGKAVIRAIVAPGSDCPQLETGVPAPLPMSLRVDTDSNFQNRVCEAPYPSGAANVVVVYGTGSSSKSMPVAPLPTAPKRILVVGDTGCAIKLKTNSSVRTPAKAGTSATTAAGKPAKKPKVQACNDPDEWPFMDIADQAASLKPDLVIHVGDYHYRESACPDNSGDPKADAKNAKKCANSPYGDQWDSWNADFFTPAQSLLAAAPWIFVRGNHEICARAHEGFFRYLGPGPAQDGCTTDNQKFTVAPFKVSFDNFEGIVLDSSNGAISAKTWKSLEPLQMQNGWVLTHRPAWMGVDEAKASNSDDDLPDALAPETVGAPAGMALLISGHRHLYRASSFMDKRPSQFVVGNGGTKLEGNPPEYEPTTPEQTGSSVDNNSTTLSTLMQWDDFGFALMTPAAAPQAWNIDVYNADKEIVSKCTWSGPNTQQTHCISTGINESEAPPPGDD